MIRKAREIPIRLQCCVVFLIIEMGVNSCCTVWLWLSFRTEDNRWGLSSTGVSQREKRVKSEYTLLFAGN